MQTHTLTRTLRVKSEIYRGTDWHVVRKSAAYPNSFQQLWNSVSGWSRVHYLLISAGKKPKGENRKTGGTKRKIKPWKRVHFAQKSRPSALLSRSSPGDKLWSLLPRARRAPAVGRAVRLEAPWLRRNWCVRARAWTLGLMHQYYLYTIKRKMPKRSWIFEQTPP